MSEDRYKVLRKITDTYFNDIPVIVNDIVICTDLYTDKKIVKVSIKNIGDKTVRNFKMNLNFIDKEGKLKEKCVFLFNAVELKSNCMSELEVNLEFKEIDIEDDIKVIVNECDIEGLPKYQDEIELYKHKETSLNDLGEIGEQYKREVSSFVSSFYVENKFENFGSVWHCACGNYCFEDIDVCPVCNSLKSDFERINSEQYLKEKLQEYKKNREKKQKEIQDNAAKIGKNAVKIVILCIISIIIGRIVFLIGRDLIVKNAIKDNDIGKAIRLNDNALDKYDSYIEKLLLKYESDNDIDGEKELIDALLEYVLDDRYSEKKLDIQYKLFFEELNNENYDNAFMYLEQLIHSEKYKSNANLLEKAKEVYYFKALEYIDSQKYEEAKNLLEKTDYADSETKMDIVYYYMAKKYFDNKQYKDAIELFEEIDTPYEDSSDLLMESRYNYLIERFEKYKTSDNYNLETLETIGNEFNEMSDYKESKNYYLEIEEALKWHGTWHNDVFGKNYYYDITFNYFTGVKSFARKEI